MKKKKRTNSNRRNMCCLKRVCWLFFSSVWDLFSLRQRKPKTTGIGSWTTNSSNDSKHSSYFFVVLRCSLSIYIIHKLMSGTTSMTTTNLVVISEPIGLFTCVRCCVCGAWCRPMDCPINEQIHPFNPAHIINILSVGLIARIQQYNCRWPIEMCTFLCTTHTHTHTTPYIAFFKYERKINFVIHNHF